MNGIPTPRILTVFDYLKGLGSSLRLSFGEPELLVLQIMTHKPYMDLFQTLMTRAALGQIGFGVFISGISSFSKCVLI